MSKSESALARIALLRAGIVEANRELKMVALEADVSERAVLDVLEGGAPKRRTTKRARIAAALARRGIFVQSEPN